MRVLILCDRPVVAAALAATLERHLAQATTRVVAGVSDCPRILAAWRPELVTVDLGATQSEIRQLCIHLQDRRVPSVHLVDGPDAALELLEANAAGVTTPDDGLEGVATAAEVVLGGNTHVPPGLLGGVLRGLIDRRRATDGSTADVARLSAREREVLVLLGSGLDQNGIARSLAISPQTAKTHIRHVMTKLGVRSRVAAAAKAAEMTQGGRAT